jgi:hypothetical protein
MLKMFRSGGLAVSSRARNMFTQMYSLGAAEKLHWVAVEI